MNRIASGTRDLADVVQQEAELDLRRVGDLQPRGAGQLEPVGGDPLGVLAGVGVARLDGVGERAHGGDVGAPQLLRAGALLLEDLAQVGGVALELALARGGLALRALDAGAQRRDGVLFVLALTSRSPAKAFKCTGRWNAPAGRTLR